MRSLEILVGKQQLGRAIRKATGVMEELYWGLCNARSRLSMHLDAAQTRIADAIGCASRTPQLTCPAAAMCSAFPKLNTFPFGCSRGSVAVPLFQSFYLQ